MVIFRAWTHTEAVSAVAGFFAAKPPRTAAIRKLMEGVCSAHPAARKQATDLARLVSAREPGILSDWADLLMDVLAELSADAANPNGEWQSRGYLALASVHNVTRPAQRQRLAVLLRPMTDDPRTALRATALEAFTRLALVERGLLDEALALLNEARVSGKAAIRSRARLMLKLYASGQAQNRRLKDRQSWRAIGP